MNCKFLLSLAFVSSAGFLNAQGLIINEISQGPTGSKEFIELLVVGSNAQKTGVVDISNWIIDDQNGDFKLSDNTSPGIAIGHFRFVANDTTRNMPIGSIIVLYNAADKNTAWTFPKLSNGVDSFYIATNSAGTSTYYIPGTSKMLRAVSGTPNNTSNSYTYTTSTIPPIGQNWNGELGLANNGDAIQTRKPDGTFYHGFGFSTPNATNVFTSFPTFSEVGLPSFNGFKGVAGGKDTYFTCGSWYFATPFITGNASSVETPGQPNTTDNGSLITQVANGQIDYSLLNSDIPCGQVLPIFLSSIEAHVQSGTVVIAWTMSTEINNKYFLVQRSQDQQNWQELGKVNSVGNSSVEQNYTFTDKAPVPGLNYYRVVQVDMNGLQSNSTPVSVKTGGSEINSAAYPNPVVENNFHLKIGTEGVKNILITNTAGKVFYKDDNRHKSEVLTIPVTGWAKGIYFIKLTRDSGYQTIKLSRD